MTDSESRLDLLSGVPMPLVLIGADERIRALNSDAEALFGQGMAGRHYFTVLRKPGVADMIAKCLETGQDASTRLQERGHNHDATFLVRAAVVGSSAAREVLVSFHDITAVEEAGQMRRDFVANVSHELRTPLTALIGFIETLRGPAREDDVARERFLETMMEEAGRMNRLIDDLLSLSRVESEERVRPTERVDLAAVIDTVCRTLQPLADEADVTLESLIRGTTVPVETPGDLDQLVQVFSNLVVNAIKYGGDGGRVVVTLSRLKRDPVLRAPAIQVQVKDFGQGIEEMHLHRLTERFYRGDDHRSRSVGGTGLGLAIVKHIVNRHRGRLKIRSELGEGSCFSVVLPVAGL